ncbi:hypothetical protein SO802_010110 [Lithocarpus litseifolius]|uniref:Uncharacterized protein n=1 Tax=Lithocarpus litseifolius TaxID=425828 RepID=A0AAW2DFZ7_9ROSI
MSSEASSEQLCVHEGAGYDEVYPLGQDNLRASYPKRVPSTNSSSEEEKEDLDVDGSKSSSNEDSDEESVENVNSSIRSVVGLDGLRKFVLPLMWTVNDFNPTIKQKHFDTLRERYQIPVRIPIRLPFKFEKCYYQDAEDIGRVVMMKGLTDRCMAREKLVDYLKERSEATEMERNELKASWEVQVKKFDVTRKALKETEAQDEALKKVLKDKEGEISLLKKQFLRAKKDGKTEFHTSNSFLFELGGCFADSFNDYFRQVKASFPDLDLSQISIDAAAQTLARSFEFKDTDELFDDAPTPDAQGDRKPVLQDEQAISVEDETRPFEEAKTNEKEKVVDEGTSANQP